MTNPTTDDRVREAIRDALDARISTARLDALLDGIAPQRFVRPDGTVDSFKITAYADRIASITTGDTGDGDETGGDTGRGTVAAGRDRYTRRKETP